MNARGLASAQPRRSVLEVPGEHPRRQYRDASLTTHRAVQVGAAEDEQRCDLMVRETLDGLRLGVCLPQPPLIDACDRHSARVTLGLDREDPTGADHDVVDVAAPEVDVMDGEPACGTQAVEKRTDILLAVGPAIP